MDINSASRQKRRDEEGGGGVKRGANHSLIRWAAASTRYPKDRKARRRAKRQVDAAQHAEEEKEGLREIARRRGQTEDSDMGMRVTRVTLIS